MTLGERMPRIGRFTRRGQRGSDPADAMIQRARPRRHHKDIVNNILRLKDEQMKYLRCSELLAQRNVAPANFVLSVG